MHSAQVVRRATASALVALVLLIGALLAAAPKASADDSCVANMVCIWDQINYGGAKNYYDCNLLGTYGTPSGNPYRSAKNRCGSKYIILNTPWGGVCMGPGGDRPSPGYFTSVTLLNWGQTC